MRSCKVLFACAQADVIDRMTAGLEDFGYEVVSCTRGETALELAADHRVDVAILAMDLIGYNGFEICRRLRARCSDAELPIVIYASRDSRQWRLTAFESGANSFCFEPILYDRLDSVIRSLLRFRSSLENSIPIVDALTLLGQAYANPGVPAPVRDWPTDLDVSKILRYCDSLLEARTQLESVRVDETRLLLHLILQMAIFLGSLDSAIGHLEHVAVGTGIETVATTLARRLRGKDIVWRDEDFRIVIESLTLLLGLADRMYREGEEPGEALRRMRGDELGYDEALLLALESVVSKDEFLSSIFD